MRRRARRHAAARRLLLLVAAGVAASGCAGEPERRGGGAVGAGDRPAVVGGEAVVAVAGSVVVVPASGVAAGEVRATINGERVPATAHRVVIEPRGAGPREWRPAEPVWREAAPGEEAATVVRVVVPPGAADGVIRIGATERPLRVIEAGVPSAEPAPVGRADLYGAERAGAGEAWRLELAGLGMGYLAERHPAERAAAVGLSAKWKAALVRLERIDAWLANRVMLALTRTAEVSGVRAPAWSLDADADARLLEDLLDESLGAGRTADRARAWLAAQDELAARVRDPASAGVIAAQVTDLAGRTARAELSDGRRSGAPALLAAHGSALIPAPAGAAEADRPFLIASAGRRSVEIPRPVSEIAARPPGARLGPLAIDLNMSDWLGRTARPLPRELAAGALVQRRASGNAWEVYIEAKTAAGVRADSVTLWLGPREASVAAVRIGAGGEIERVAGLSAALLSHETSEDRWSALVAIPAEAIRPDGTLLVGLTRELEVGCEALRGSWPVALLPWEEEPGRVEIDLTGWMGL